MTTSRELALFKPPVQHQGSKARLAATCHVDDNGNANVGVVPVVARNVHVQPVAGVRAVGDAAQDTLGHKVENAHLQVHCHHEAMSLT